MRAKAKAIANSTAIGGVRGRPHAVKVAPLQTQRRKPTMHIAAATSARTLNRADPRWAAVVARDPGADGQFVYSVRTTGVYCRPSCASRRARRENVEFHESPAAARLAGFRACKRCRPDEARGAATAQWVAQLCRFIASTDRSPSLDELSRQAGLSKFHLLRTFKHATGLTPAAYARGLRAHALRESLARGGEVTHALYGAGYGSQGRFYAESDGILGMTPTQFKRGGIDAGIRYALGACSLGMVLVAQSERGICAILIGDDSTTLVQDLERRFHRATIAPDASGLDGALATVIRLADFPALGTDLPLDIRGTAFQQRVWKALRGIAPGTTISYAELARRIGAATAVRAVAQACANNAIALAIPCHRVVRSDGALAGYCWGVERKRELLEREKRK
jgi:AraC family transcriptional regulator, regulatory protein of adaptative response / methylated-DNA-[protein]-cysteine methyltransferase